MVYRAQGGLVVALVPGLCAHGGTRSQCGVGHSGVSTPAEVSMGASLRSAACGACVCAAAASPPPRCCSCRTNSPITCSPCVKQSMSAREATHPTAWACAVRAGDSFHLCCGLLALAHQAQDLAASVRALLALRCIRVRRAVSCSTKHSGCSATAPQVANGDEARPLLGSDGEARASPSPAAAANR